MRMMPSSERIVICLILRELNTALHTVYSIALGSYGNRDHFRPHRLDVHHCVGSLCNFGIWNAQGAFPATVCFKDIKKGINNIFICHHDIAFRHKFISSVLIIHGR